MARLVWLVLFLLGSSFSLAQEYRVGRILALGERRAQVALKEGMGEAELPQGRGGFRPGAGAQGGGGNPPRLLGPGLSH